LRYFVRVESAAVVDQVEDRGAVALRHTKANGGGLRVVKRVP
jgi:hypothetical protein